MAHPALSVSRMNDYMSCPLKFRYRTIDRIPEPPSSAATKGTLVHAVLENLFDVPAADRTVATATSLLEPSWAQMVERDPGLEALFETESFEDWMASARSLVGTYFERENPKGLNPARSNRERLINVTIGNIAFRGIVDRIDVAPNGQTRIVDYKTGKMPRPAYQQSALLQLRVYGLMLHLAEGRQPTQAQLIYLGSNDTLTYWTDPSDLEIATETIERVWSQILESLETEFAPKKSKLCDWCSFQSICPAFGGETPAMPSEGRDRLIAIGQPPQQQH